MNMFKTEVKNALFQNVSQVSSRESVQGRSQPERSGWSPALGGGAREWVVGVSPPAAGVRGLRISEKNIFIMQNSAF